MNKEEIKQFENEQLNTLLEELKDIDKFTGFSNGAFKYELGKYQASLLLEYINNLKQALIDIRELIKKDSIEIDEKYTEVCCSGENFLQIIDKVLDLDKVRGK